MNATLESFARQTLKTNVPKLTDAYQYAFKLMYGRRLGPRHSFDRTPEQAVALTVEQVVDTMQPDALDWAMSQVERTMDRPDCLRPLAAKPHLMIDYSHPRWRLEWSSGHPGWRCSTCAEYVPDLAILVCRCDEPTITSTHLALTVAQARIQQRTAEADAKDAYEAYVEAQKRAVDMRAKVEAVAKSTIGNQP